MQTILNYLREKKAMRELRAGDRAMRHAIDNASSPSQRDDLIMAAQYSPRRIL